MNRTSSHRTAWLRQVPAFDLALGTGLAVFAVVDTASRPGLVHPWTEVLGALAVGSIVVRTLAPAAMCLVAGAAAACYGALPGTGSPLWLFVGILVIAFSAGANLAGRRRLMALGVLLVCAYILQLLTTSRVPPADYSWADVYISPVVIVLGPALGGWLLQRSRRQTAEVRQLAAELHLARERHGQEAAAAERTRIARELHDVISHSVSVMVVQAGAAGQLLPLGSPAREQVEAIRTTGKEAMAELRRQLGVLRSDAVGSTAPMPGVADIARLVAEHGAALRTDGDLDSVTSPGLGLAAYRVVQEALTNAGRYAAGSPVQVHLNRAADGLHVEVIDGGRTASQPREPEGSGLGLVGMRERVVIYGGRLEAGPLGREPGWRVRVFWPIAQGPGT